MALPSYYSTGTASIANGETVVTGASTGWTAPLRAGDLFGIHVGLAVPIASVDSDTQLTLAYVWPGATQSAAAYAVQIIPDVARMQETTRQVLQQIGEGNLQALAGLTGAADKMPFFTGAGTMGIAALTAFARTLLDDSDVTSALATLNAVQQGGTSILLGNKVRIGWTGSRIGFDIDSGNVKSLFWSDVDVAQSLAGNGYIKFPNGLIIQWGSFVPTLNSGNSATVTFPISFPVNCFTVIAMGGDVNTSPSGVITSNTQPIPKTGFNFTVTGGVPNSLYRINLMAVGN